MISVLSMASLFGGFRKSLLAQIAAGVVAMFGVWKLNNYYVAKSAVNKVVQASKTEGNRRNAKTRKIRSSTKPSDARKRMREYARTD